MAFKKMAYVLLCLVGFMLQAYSQTPLQLPQTHLDISEVYTLPDKGYNLQ